jgi:hypothetical protein
MGLKPRQTHEKPEMSRCAACDPMVRARVAALTRDWKGCDATHAGSGLLMLVDQAYSGIFQTVGRALDGRVWRGILL